MMREVSLETFPNVNIRDPSHDKNLPIMSVTGSINQNVFKLQLLFTSIIHTFFFFFFFVNYIFNDACVF